MLCSRVKLLLFIISLTVHRKTNFLVNLYWDNKYSDSDSDSDSPAPASLEFLVSPAGPANDSLTLRESPAHLSPLDY